MFMFPRFSVSRNSVELGPQRPDKNISKKFKSQRDVGLQQMPCFGEIFRMVGKGHMKPK